jgi:Sulfotransferase domain
MSPTRLPNLVIAGVGKAGTTSLFSYLAQHPDICASTIKETNYFIPLRHGQELEPISAYARYFTHCGRERYVMEATPGYFYGGERLIQTLNATLPDARFLVILRDPSRRLWSYFNFMKTRLRIDRELTLDEYLETALELRAQGKDKRRENNAYWALSSGFYADYISEWFEAFESSFRVIFFEDLASEPQSVVEKLCHWLGVSLDPASSFDYSAENKTVLHGNERLQRIALAANDRGERFFRRHPGLENALKRLYYGVNRKDDFSRFDPEIHRRLDAVYGPSNVVLADELRRRGYDKLPGWLPVDETTGVAS